MGAKVIYLRLQTLMLLGKPYQGQNIISRFTKASPLTVQDGHPTFFKR